MATMIKEFNETHPDIMATPVYTGSYDETLIKTRAAMKAGKPPAAAIMSANFLTDLKIEGEIAPLDDLIKASNSTNEKFMRQFLPALHGNAVLDRKSMACRSTIRRRCSTTMPSTSRKPASIPTSRRSNWSELVGRRRSSPSATATG